MKSKRATKETGIVFSSIVTTMKANIHEITVIHFAEVTNICRAASVIPLPPASSVTHVVTQS